MITRDRLWYPRSIWFVVPALAGELLLLKGTINSLGTMSKEHRAKTQRRANGRRREVIPPPAYFLSLEVENVRCFGPRQRLDLSLANGRRAQWTVILGDNGTGKTTLLQCLASLESSPVQGQPELVATRFGSRVSALGWRPYRSGIDTFKIEAELAFGAKLNGPDTFRSTRIGAGIYGHPPRVKQNKRHPEAASRVRVDPYVERWLSKSEELSGLICYGYSAARRMAGVSLGERAPADSSANLFNDDSALLNAAEWLLQADYAATKPSPVQKQARRRRDEIKRVLTEILPDVDDIRFTGPSEEYPTPGVRFKTPYGWVSVEDLSLGYRTLMAWMVDFASRMFERYPYSPNPIAEPAIVLVDEIDLHLHPKWQRDLIGYLSERFINTRFIVTAHSPLVVQAAQDANVALLRREGDHVVIDNDVERIKGWRVDQVLTSDLFGLESLALPSWMTCLQNVRSCCRKEGLQKKTGPPLRTWRTRSARYRRAKRPNRSDRSTLLIERQS
jgi:energy-coupling factor transporter ATP-binding protein EcfA2